MPRYLCFIPLLFLVFGLSVGFAHAGFAQDIGNTLMSGTYRLIWLAINVTCCFMVGSGTFVILFIFTIIDIFLFRVPSFSIIDIFLGEDEVK